jgi:hypothetical protein
MTRDDIIALAETCGLPEFENDESQAENILCFAALVADAEAKRIHDEGMVTVGHMREQILAEREACAKLCEEEICDCCWDDDAQAAAEHLAAVIRARSE